MITWIIRTQPCVMMRLLQLVLNVSQENDLRSEQTSLEQSVLVRMFAVESFQESTPAVTSGVVMPRTSKAHVIASVR